MNHSNLTVFKEAVAEWHASKGSNFEAWLSHAHDDIQMKSLGQGARGMRFPSSLTGKEAFADYLQGHHKQIELQSFEIAEYVEQGDRIAGFGTVSLAGRDSGKACTTDVALFARFKDGKIIELMEYFDTKRLADAFAA